MKYHPTDHRKNITEFWRQFFPDYEIPNGYHVHHIYPRVLCEQDGWPEERLQ